MAKTWGDVYRDACARGEDQSVAAHLADEWEKRAATKKNQTPKPDWQAIAQGLADALEKVIPFAQDASYGGPDIQDALTNGHKALAAYAAAEGGR